MQDDILGHHPGTHGAFEEKAHRFRHLDQQLAGAENESGIRVADAGRELIESTGHAGVRISAEKNLAGAGMSFPGKRRMADPGVFGTVLFFGLPERRVELPMPVLVVDDVVEIRKPLLFDELAQQIDVAVGHGVGRENVMIGNNDDLLLVPDFGVPAELALEDADRARTANIVRHQEIHVYPHVITRFDARFAAGTREDFFGQSHKGATISLPFAAMQTECLF